MLQLKTHRNVTWWHRVLLVPMLGFGGRGYVHTATHPTVWVIFSAASAHPCSWRGSAHLQRTMWCVARMSSQDSSAPRVSCLASVCTTVRLSKTFCLFVCLFLTSMGGNMKEVDLWFNAIFESLNMSHIVMSALWTWIISFPILINSSQVDKLNSHLELWKCNCSTIWSAVIFYDDYMKKQQFFSTITVNHHDAFRSWLCRSGFCPKAILKPEDQLPGHHGWWPGKVSFIFPLSYFEVNA